MSDDSLPSISPETLDVVTGGVTATDTSAQLQGLLQSITTATQTKSASGSSLSQLLPLMLMARGAGGGGACPCGCGMASCMRR